MPKSNVTGQPITGATITCGVYSSPDFATTVQTAQTCTEQANGLYNCTFHSENMVAGACYIINCSTTINTVVNQFAVPVCVMPSITCAQVSDVINSTTVILENMSANFTNIDGRIALVLDNITLVLGNESEVKDLINSLENLTAEEVWEYPIRELTEGAVCRMDNPEDVAPYVWLEEYSGMRTAYCLNCSGENNTYYENNTYNFTIFEGPQLTKEQLKNMSKYLYVYSTELKEKQKTEMFGYPAEVVIFGGLFVIVCGVISFYIGLHYINSRV